METMSEKMNTIEKSNRGGARQGSGRKPRLEYSIREKFNSLADEKIQTWFEMLDRHIKSGNLEALKFGLEQRMGKAAQNLDMTTKSVSYSLSQPVNIQGGIDIMEMVKRISAELKTRKTSV